MFAKLSQLEIITVGIYRGTVGTVPVLEKSKLSL